MSAPPEKYGFDPARLYRPQDEAMRQLGSVSQLATWRCRKMALPYMVVGGKVFYAGADIIRHLNERRVKPRAA